jgi:hypothetical protein
MSDWRIKAKGVHELVPRDYKPYSMQDLCTLTSKLLGKAAKLASTVHGDQRGLELYREEAKRLLADIRVYLELAAAACAVDLDVVIDGRLRNILGEKWPDFLDHLSSLPEDQFECVCQRLCDDCVKAERSAVAVEPAKVQSADGWTHRIDTGAMIGIVRCNASELRERRVTAAPGDDSEGEYCEPEE